MTCERLETELLGDLGDALDPHVAQCPDCSARASGYRRIAGWVADGRTAHQPPAGWRQRTLARVLADSGPLRSMPPATSEPAPAARVEAADRPAKPPGTAAGSEANRGNPTPTRRLRSARWARVAMPIASAAVVLVVAMVVIRRGDPQPSRIAVEAQPPASGGGDTAPGAAGVAGPAGVPRTPAQEPPSIHDTGDGSAGEAAAPPSTGPTGTGRRGGKPSTQHPGDTVRPAPAAEHPVKRGGDVVVDWPSEASTPDHRGSVGYGPGGTGSIERAGSASGPGVTGDFEVTGRPSGGSAGSAGSPRSVQLAFDLPTGDLGGLTTDEVQRIVKTRAGLFRNCYTKELQRTPGIAGTLVVRIQIGGDGQVESVDRSASNADTLRSEPVAQCVSSNIKHLKFPAKGGTAHLTYSIGFTQGD